MNHNYNKNRLYDTDLGIQLIINEQIFYNTQLQLSKYA